MKIISYAFLILFVFVSCEKVEDDSGLICTEECSSISGKVYTHSEIPVKNVLLNFRFHKSGGQHLVLSRVISKQRTDKLGQFNMSFYVEDEEIGETSGSFELYADRNSIPNGLFYPSVFGLSNSNFDIQSRDYSAQRNLYLPTFKKIKIELKNFNPIAPDDYFSVMSMVPCGFDTATINPETGNRHPYSMYGLNKYVLNNYQNNSTSKLFEVHFALNELNFIVIRRMKNNAYTEEIIPIQVTINSNEVYQYNY